MLSGPKKFDSEGDTKCKNEDGDNMKPNNKPFLIGVSGGTASGKSSVCKKIVEHLNAKGDCEPSQRVFVVSLDSFYKDLNEDEIAQAAKYLYNFDHPGAFDYDLLKSTMLKILCGEPVQIYQYDHINFKRTMQDSVMILDADVVLIEGILVFYQEDIKSLFDMKVFVETDADTRLARRVLRDIEVLGRDLERILNQYITFVKPAFEEFCLPTKKYADVIIPRGAENDVAIDVIVQHIKDILKTRSASSQQCNNSNQQQQKLFRSTSSTNPSLQSATLLNLRPH